MSDQQGLDLGEVLRAARRSADLSQRELACRAGLAQPFVARIESGAVGNPTFRTVERLLSAAGVTLSLLPSASPLLSGRIAADQGGQEELRDRAGRHPPAHLDAVPTRPEVWRKAWWASSMARDRWPLETVPTVTFDRVRSVRDERRARQARGATASIMGPVEDREGGDDAVPGWVWTARSTDGQVVGELRAHGFDDLIDGRAVRPLVTVAPGTVVLDSVVVAEGWRRLGIGKRLVGALRSAEPGAVVALVVGNDMEGLLAACGFAPTRSLLPPSWLVLRAV